MVDNLIKMGCIYIFSYSMLVTFIIRDGLPVLDNLFILELEFMNHIFIIPFIFTYNPFFSIEFAPNMSFLLLKLSDCFCQPSDFIIAVPSLYRPRMLSELVGYSLVLSFQFLIGFLKSGVLGI